MSILLCAIRATLTISDRAPSRSTRGILHHCASTMLDHTTTALPTYLPNSTLNKSATPSFSSREIGYAGGNLMIPSSSPLFTGPTIDNSHSTSLPLSSTMKSLANLCPLMSFSERQGTPTLPRSLRGNAILTSWDR